MFNISIKDEYFNSKNILQHSSYIVDDQRPKGHKNNSLHMNTNFKLAASSLRENATPFSENKVNLQNT